VVVLLCPVVIHQAVLVEPPLDVVVVFVARIKVMIAARI
jgi:hypothetical protein